MAWWAIPHFNITASATLMSKYKNVEDIIGRAVMILISIAAIISMLLLVPNRKIPLLSMIGKNSLLIYLAHRFITIVFYKELFPYKSYSHQYLIYALVATVLTCVVLGGERLNKSCTTFVNMLTKEITDERSKKGQVIKIGIFCIIIALLGVNMIL